MKITKTRLKEIVKEELAQEGILQMLGMKDKSVEQDLDHIENRLHDFIRGAYDESADEKEQYETLKRLFKELQPLQRSDGPGNKKQMERARTLERRLADLIVDIRNQGLKAGTIDPRHVDMRARDVERLKEKKDDKWIQGAEDDIEKRGTEGVCTGDKFGGPSCKPGTKRYNLAKTFRKMAKDKKK